MWHNIFKSQIKTLHQTHNTKKRSFVLLELFPCLFPQNTDVDGDISISIQVFQQQGTAGPRELYGAQPSLMLTVTPVFFLLSHIKNESTPYIMNQTIHHV